MADNTVMEKRSNTFPQKTTANQNEVRVTPSGVAVKSYNRDLVRHELEKLVKSSSGKKTERTESQSSNN